jgi:DNA-binding CsgD family transcriptional regulator
MTRKIGESEQDRQIGICLGSGMSPERAATHLGVAANTVRNHIATNGDYILKVKSETETILAVNAAKKVADVVGTAEERIKGLFDKAFRLTERAIQKAEDKGDDIELSELMEIHNRITVWASKFAASEAPKRLEVNGSVEQVHTLSGDVVDRLTAFMQKHQNLLPASRPEVLDAVVVE